MSDPKEVALALAAPFEADEIKYKPQSVTGDRALAIAYIDARVVMDRLDDALGVGGWQTAYRTQEDGVVCRLRARIAGEWVEHEDVGSFSEQPDDGDKLKAAFSDALKRAAIHLGVGRYLYRLPRAWVDYDAKKRQILKPPPLPDWARPRTKAAPAPAPAAPKLTPQEYDARLAGQGFCQKGDLLAWLRHHLGDLWEQSSVEDQRACTAKFLAERNAARASSAKAMGVAR